MATTTLIPLHTGKGGSTFSALVRSINYVENPNKTNDGEWVAAYECDPLTIAEEFMFSKHEYAVRTGRDYGTRNVIAYHLRQAFKPGEIDPATANKIGYDLAMSLTKGKYAFLVCTHIDKHHVHNHVIFNSVSLDCTRKFRNFKNSSFAIRKISDQLCIENGLSVIEKPKPSRGNYDKWLGDKKPPTARDTLREMIDNNLIVGKTFSEFLVALKTAGCAIKVGKHIAIKIPGAKKNIRLNSLGDDYSEAAIMERLSGKRIISAKSKINAPVVSEKPMSLLIDVQAKIRDGAHGGYTQWMKVFNVKQAGKTLVFLQENNISSYEDLCEKTSAISGKFRSLTGKINDIETRLTEISDLQKQIGTYSKTREIYEKYIASGKDEDFYDGHTAAIVIFNHAAARQRRA